MQDTDLYTCRFGQLESFVKAAIRGVASVDGNKNSPIHGVSPRLPLADFFVKLWSVLQLDFLLVRRQQTVALHPRKNAAHGLEREPEVAADLLARHAQAEARGGVAHPLIPAREAQQERGDPLLRV